MISKSRSRVVRRLRTRRGRSDETLFLVEGVRGVEEALDAGLDVSFAVVSPGLAQTARGRELEARIRRLELDMEPVDEGELEELSDTETPQGVLLVCAEPGWVLDELGSAPGQGILILDAVQDPGNLGTLVRAARAFGLRGVVALDGTVDPWNPKAVRAAAGASFHLPLLKEDWSVVEAWARTRELSLLASDPAGVDVAGVRVAGEWALVVGNEGAGVRSQVLKSADRVVSVPMAGGTESLNVGVAGAVLLYALARRRRG